MGYRSLKMFRFTGIILAGGKSSRMGTDKGLTFFRGKRLVEYPLDLLGKFCAEILISAGDSGYNQFKVPVIKDVIPNKGPLGGIYSTMNHSKGEWFIVLACDLPFVNDRLISELIFASREEYDCIVPFHHGMLEPLVAVYHRRIMPDLKEALTQNLLSLYRLIYSSRPCLVNVEKILENEPDIFSNMNNPEDLL